jgi:hypothetical protein
MSSSGEKIGMRRHLVGYSDRNDGFCRSYFSRSKNRSSRNRKVGKVERIKPEHKAASEVSV